MHIRRANREDIDAVVAIYNQAIAQGNATADIQIMTVEDKLSWFESHLDDQYPLFVCTIDNQIIGWGSLSGYRKGRMALRHVVEVSYYLDYKHHGQGIGKQLFTHLMASANQIGFKYVVAILLEVNSSSRHFLEKHGFEIWGHLPKVVHLSDGSRCGHMYYGKEL